MDGDKFNSAIRTAVAVAKAVSMIDDVTCMITMRCTYTESTGKGRQMDRRPCMFIVYDSTKDRLNSAFLEKLYKLDVCGGTPEGLFYEAALTLIENSSKGRDSHVINISDGEPCWSNGYAGYISVRHTKSVIDKFRSLNINVMSYFVSKDEVNERLKEDFIKMYGKSACFIDVSSLTQLANSINRLLEYAQK